MTKRPSLGALTAPNWQAPNGCIAVLIIACSANCQNLSVADVQETGVCWGNSCAAALDSKRQFRRPPDFRNSSLSWKQCNKALSTFCLISYIFTQKKGILEVKTLKNLLLVKSNLRNSLYFLLHSSQLFKPPYL